MEKKKHVYRVRFLVKKGGERWYAVDLEAENAQAAKKSARAMWQGKFLALAKTAPHAFDMSASRRDAEGVEYAFFKRVEV